MIFSIVWMLESLIWPQNLLFFYSSFYCSMLLYFWLCVIRKIEEKKMRLYALSTWFRFSSSHSSHHMSFMDDTLLIFYSLLSIRIFLFRIHRARSHTKSNIIKLCYKYKYKYRIDMIYIYKKSFILLLFFFVFVCCCCFVRF